MIFLKKYSYSFGHSECNIVKKDKMSLAARNPAFVAYANNKGADQPAHKDSLVSTLVICSHISMIN